MRLSEKYNQNFSENAYTFLENIKSRKRDYNEKEYSLFYPMIGKNYLKHKDFLIIGRATNGWSITFNPNNKDISSVIQQSIEHSQPEHEGECALEWVNQKWRKKEMTRSHFWLDFWF